MPQISDLNNAATDSTGLTGAIAGDSVLSDASTLTINESDDLTGGPPDTANTGGVFRTFSHSLSLSLTDNLSITDRLSFSDPVNESETGSFSAGGGIVTVTESFPLSDRNPDRTGSLAFGSLTDSLTEPFSNALVISQVPSLTDSLSLSDEFVPRPSLSPLDTSDFLPGSLSGLPDIDDVDETDTVAICPREPTVLSEPTGNTILSTVSVDEASEISALIQSVNYSLLLE